MASGTPDARLLLLRALDHDRAALVRAWVASQRELPELRLELVPEDAMVEEAGLFLERLQTALEDAHGATADELGLDETAWDALKALVAEVTRSRTRLGWEPSEVAIFLLSLKRPLFERLRSLARGEEVDVVEALWFATRLVDLVGLYATQVLIEAREETIERQREEMLEVSTPVVPLWDGVIALPLIGTLDSHRTHQVMEVMLNQIDRRNARVAILDITGVPTVDSATAQHLLRTARAAALMGAECVISGIRPATAQTIVSLGIDLGAMQTRSSMQAAVAYALDRTGLTIGRRGSGA